MIRVLLSAMQEEATEDIAEALIPNLVRGIKSGLPHTYSNMTSSSIASRETTDDMTDLSRERDRKPHDLCKKIACRATSFTVPTASEWGARKVDRPEALSESVTSSSKLEFDVNCSAKDHVLTSTETTSPQTECLLFTRSVFCSRGTRSTAQTYHDFGCLTLLLTEWRLTL
jgi:hypothetical protein